MTSTPPPPPFDPELAAALELIKEFISPGMTMADIDEIRRGPAIMQSMEMDLTLGGAFAIEDREVAGPVGEPGITLLIGRPTAPATAGALPVIYHVHGGGMVLGDRRVGVTGALEYARELDAVVVSVEYRLAPEHPHPAPIEDVYAGLLWTAEHAKEIGGDPERIVIMGASAGGGLSAALALLTRDRGGPRPIGQLLLCPMLDDRNDTPSSHQMAGLGVWDRTANETGWTALLGDRRGTPDVSPYAAPARATDLTGLPRPSWTSAPRRPSATRSSPTRPASGSRAAPPNSTSGRAASTASTVSLRRRRCRRRLGLRMSVGCGGCWGRGEGWGVRLR